MRRISKTDDKMVAISMFAGNDRKFGSALGIWPMPKHLASTMVHLMLAAGLLTTSICKAVAQLSLISRPISSFAFNLAQDSPPPTAPSASPTPAAPATTPGNSASLDVVVADWQQSLSARLRKFQRYPAQARGATGTVSLAFSIDRKGNITSSRIEESSGSPVLDTAALALIKRAAPLPPPPSGLADADLSFIIPIRFAGPQ